METSGVTTIASGTTLTRSTVDSLSGRDQADRWTSTTLQLSGYGALTLGRSFDNAGRVAAQSGAGFTSAGSYAYNATSGLKSGQTLPLALGGTVSDSYTYRPDGRLATWGSATYSYDAAFLLKLSATQGSTSWRIDYLYDEEGKVYGGVYRSPSTSTSPTYFTMVTNDHGDVLELLDANGSAFVGYRYDPWGLPLATGTTTTSTSIVNSTLAGQIASRQILRYASYAFDAESGLYYCSARYYDPATRQWTTADSAKADGEQSPCQYCAGNPIRGTDPTGLDQQFYLRLKSGVAKNFKSRIKQWAKHYADAKTPYLWGGPAPSAVAAAGYWGMDCSGYAQEILYKAKINAIGGHLPNPNTDAGKRSGDALYDLSKPAHRGHPSNKYFDADSRTPYQVGDLLVEAGVHTVLVVSDGTSGIRVAEEPHTGAHARIRSLSSSNPFNESARFFGSYHHEQR